MINTPPINHDSTVMRYQGFSLLLSHSALFSTIVISLILLISVIASLALGSTFIPLNAALPAIFGQGSHSTLLLVQEIRLPRIFAGLITGAALGSAGCLIQTMARNRLASPDLLGINNGATLAIILGLIIGNILGSWWLALIGAATCALLIFMLAGRWGRQGYRVLVIGLAIAVMLRSVIELLMSTVSLQHASTLYTWSLGSLVGRGYSASLPAAFGLTLLLPAALLLSRRLALLRFEEDLAASLGLNVSKTQFFIMLLTIGLAGLGVTIGGPIGFIALAAPIIASRFANPAHIPIFRSALIGAIVIICADTLGRITNSHAEVPVGVITSILGGPFLLWVLLSKQ